MNIHAGVRRLDLAREEQGTDVLVESVYSFLRQFRWANVKEPLWVGESIPGVLGLFLVELMPSEEDIDQFIWVVVGDVPPAYLSSQFANSPREALECYIAEMRAWVMAVRQGEPVDDLIPVNADPTQENASALSSRLSFLEERIVPDLE